MTSSTPAPVKLLPCAHCGGVAQTFQAEDNDWEAYCTNDDCGSMIDGFKMKRGAIAAWNRRSGDWPVEAMEKIASCKCTIKSRRTR